MNNFRFNLKGQLNEVKLPEYKALWPLFETIVNSIQSIEESTNSQNGQITILANRLEDRQVNMDGNEELNPFYEFQVIDNGEGFNSINYNSFLEAYSNLKVSKGCKGIGRFLWLKAFIKVNIESVYCEKNRWLKRRFEFSADNGIEPEKNIEDSSISEYKTVVTLSNFILKYRKKAPLSLEALAKKVIEHCLPYFLGDNCPHIVLRDNLGETYDLNKYFDSTIKDSLHRDEFEKDGNKFSLYHIRMAEGAVKHELHFCASKREVKSYDLSQYITDLQKRIVTDEGEAFYYLGYLTGEYLDRNVNLNRTAFDFEEEDTLFASVSERELIEIAKAKRPNGRPFVNVSNTAFYCYVIADLTDSMREDAVNAGLILTPDGDGYFGYNQTRGAYIEVISYDKLVRDAKQRNQILFDKLFNPKVNEVLNSKLLNE